MSMILHVDNIHCGACAKRVDAAIRKAAPEAKADVNIESGKVTVEGAGDAASILASLEKAGYPARLAQ